MNRSIRNEIVPMRARRRERACDPFSRTEINSRLLKAVRRRERLRGNARRRTSVAGFLPKESVLPGEPASRRARLDGAETNLGKVGRDLGRTICRLGDIVRNAAGHGALCFNCGRDLLRAMKGGAEDFLGKPATRETISAAIERALQRYDQARDRRDRINSLGARVAALTPREREVFELIVRGKLNKQIGYQLGTSERTIKARRHAIMKSLKFARWRKPYRSPSVWEMLENTGMMQTPK